MDECLKVACNNERVLIDKRGRMERLLSPYELWCQQWEKRIDRVKNVRFSLDDTPRIMWKAMEHDWMSI